jgi:hypothetical protein
MDSEASEGGSMPPSDANLRRLLLSNILLDNFAWALLGKTQYTWSRAFGFPPIIFVNFRIEPKMKGAIASLWPKQFFIINKNLQKLEIKG